MPISAESQYCIDSMFELCIIPPDIAEFTYFRQLDVDGMVDRNESLEESIPNAFHAAYETMADEEKYLYSLAFFSDAKLQLKEHFGYLANIVVDAYEKTNGLVEGQPTPAVVTSLSNVDEMLGAVEARLSARASQPYRNATRNYPELFRQAYERSISIRRRFTDFERVRDLMRNRRAAEPINVTFANNQFSLNTMAAALPDKVLKKRDRKGRQILKRSIEGLASFIGHDKVASFVHGDSITIEGNKFNFVFRRNGNVSLIDHSANPVMYHTPYDLSVVGKDGVMLADMCVVFEGTPILDQILATYLYIKSGAEEEFIKSANLYNRNEGECIARGLIKPSEPRTGDRIWMPAAPTDGYVASRQRNQDVQNVIYRNLKAFGFDRNAIAFVMGQNHPTVQQFFTGRHIQVDTHQRLAI